MAVRNGPNYYSASDLTVSEGKSLVKAKRYEEADAAFARAEVIRKSWGPTISYSAVAPNCRFLQVQVEAAQAYQNVDANRATTWATKALATCVETLAGNKGSLPRWPFDYSPLVREHSHPTSWYQFDELAKVFDALGMKREAYEASEWQLALRLEDFQGYRNKDLVRQADRADALGLTASAAAWRKEASAHAQVETSNSESFRYYFQTREEALKEARRSRAWAERYLQLNAPRLANNRLAIALRAEAAAGITPTAQQVREQNARELEIENMVAAHEANERAMVIQNLAGVAASRQKGSRVSSPPLQASAAGGAAQSGSGVCDPTPRGPDFAGNQRCCEKEGGVFDNQKTGWVCRKRGGSYGCAGPAWQCWAQ